MIHELKSYNVELLGNGVFCVYYSGDLVVTPAIELQKGTELQERLDEGTLIDSKAWLEKHRDTKKGCGKISDAMMIADAIEGMSVQGILDNEYPYKKDFKKSSKKKYCYKKYSRGKVFAALSVNKPEDYSRIRELFIEYEEEVFIPRGISFDAVCNWMYNRARKG